MSVENAPEVSVIDSETVAIIEEAITETPDNETPISPEVSSTPSPEPLDTLIRVLKSATCPSLTGRSTLGYELGIKDESELYLRLVSNTGSGFFSREWVPCSVIEHLITGVSDLTSTSFKALFPNKSVNTGGFVMAVVKELGLIHPNVQNARWHQHVSEMTFEQVAIEAMVQEEEVQQVVPPKATGKRKHKEG